MHKYNEIFNNLDGITKSDIFAFMSKNRFKPLSVIYYNYNKDYVVPKTVMTEKEFYTVATYSFYSDKMTNEDTWVHILVSFIMNENGMSEYSKSLTEMNITDVPPRRIAIMFNTDISEHIIADAMNAMVEILKNNCDIDVKYQTTDKHPLIFYHHDDYKNTILVDKSVEYNEDTDINMPIFDTYCEGKHCDKRYNCARHNQIGTREHIDYSIGSCDANHDSIYYCGDNGQYALYIPIDKNP